MEPIQSAMITVAKIILNGAGQRIGEILTDSMVQKVRGRLKNKNPRTVAQRDEAVNLIANLITENKEVAEAVKVIVTSVMENPQLKQEIEKIIKAQQDDEIEQITRQSPKEKVKQMETQIKITMIGSSGVGKTSLLAAMYEKHKSIDNLLNLNPNVETELILGDTLKALKTMANQPKPIDGIENDNDSKRYVFNIGRQRNQDLSLIFQDYPGGWLSDLKNKQNIIEFINESYVVIIAIDTIALMHNMGKWNDLVNDPTSIINIFKETYKNLEEDDRRLVILAPVKCETYMEDEKGIKAKILRQTYKQIIDFFRESLPQKIAVVLTPVQTLGCVRLTDIQEVIGQDGSLKPQYTLEKTTPGAQYSPSGGDLPLKYILRFFLKLYLDNQRNQPLPERLKRILLTPIQNLFQNNNDLENVLNQLVRKDAEIDQSTVVMGEQWLGEMFNRS